MAFGQDAHIHQAYGIIGIVLAVLFLFVWPVEFVLLRGLSLILLLASVFWYLILGHALIYGPNLFLFGFVDLLLRLIGEKPE